ncbi:AIM24 family protein [Geodermatophilus marinus]|uniref:AIM24 family protein n=1 Tax=Geodermatophilus sp. LHW52908 TaxID=2303986 RepID=UPI000E3DFF11|nr:AIM24 family protein [Geodermatophilus sp. LHW52908]RFU19286.1 AIM24 family protein [Geodermatophilus sp. LHW52908]
MAQLSAEKRVLRADLHGDRIRAASGSMVAYEGNLDFKNAGMGGGGGMRAALKRAVAGESLSLMDVTGQGRAYLAKDAMDVLVVDLGGDTLTVESEHILAHTEGLRLDVQFAGLRGMTSGHGLATTTVTGSGQVALVSEGPVMALEVAPGQDLVVDPDAYVGSRGQLSMNLVSGVSWKSLLGEDAGEPFSLRFTGHGLVLVQSSES